MGLNNSNTVSGYVILYFQQLNPKQYWKLLLSLRPPDTERGLYMDLSSLSVRCRLVGQLNKATKLANLEKQTLIPLSL